MTIMTKHRSRATLSRSGKAARSAIYGRRTPRKTWKAKLFGPVKRRAAARRRKHGGELVVMIWLRGKTRQARGALLPYVSRSVAGTTKAGAGSVSLAKARRWSRANGNTCYVCGRPLTTAESVRNGAGPRCARKAGFR